jgi:PAS domain S-box-containing protein
MSKEIELLKKKLFREEAARVEAEQLLEQKSLELYQSNEKLKHLNINLEEIVDERTKRLKETELEYQTMVESINDMIFRLDLQGNITFTNQIAHKIIGAGEKGLVGRHILDFVLPEDRKRIFTHFARQFLKRNCINYFEISIKSKYNQTNWVRLNVQFTSEKCKLCLRKQQALAGIEKKVKAEYDCNFIEIIVVAHDITQQKIDQERIAKSEKKYRELTESLPEMICEVDKNGILTYANKFAFNKFGYSAEEALNGNFKIVEIFPEEEKGKLHNNIRQIFENGKSTSTEYLAKKKNGETFSVIVYTTPIIDQKQVIGLRGVMVDITDRKKQEIEIANNLKRQVILSEISLSYNSLSDFENKTNEALRVIGEHLNVSRVYIFENSTDGKSTRNTYEWCNQGVDAQINDLQNIPYDFIPSWKKMLEEEGMVLSQNISELPPDIYAILEPQHVKSIVVLPLVEQDKPIGFIGFDECSINRSWSQSEIELLRTIASLFLNNFLRQRIQNNLVESEKENRIIINSIPDVIIHVDFLGEIKALKSAPGSNLSNLIKGEDSKSIFTAFNEKLAKSFHEAIVECLNLDNYQFEFKNLNWDEVEYYEARLVKLNDKEVLIIVRDLTLFKEHEKQLVIAKNNAEEASKMKSEFLANVSHEIRTPLNAILGFSQWLFENTDINLHKGYLKSIINSGKSLLDVINDILDLSKLESGAIDIELSPMNYSEIVADVKLAFQDELEKKGLNFKISIEESIPNYILMDELRFYQIIFNLVSNAVKFTDKGYIHIFAVAVETEIEDEITLIVSVEDSGIGIKKEEQKKIFESFTQQDGKSNRKHDGTGLGLAIVDGLLKKLNATIDVQSEEGKGATFTLTFNRVKVDHTYYDDRQIDGEGQETTMVLGPCTVMIVDDIDFNIEVLKTLINSDQVRYIDAIDGNEALAKLKVEKPDVIFMDIRMPGMDGFEATRIIKSDEKLKDIPVIAFSASTIKSRSDLITLLFDDLLQKPVFKKEVEAMLVKYLPNHLVYTDEKTVARKPEKEQPAVVFSDNLPEIIHHLENEFLQKWEAIKGSLVIYEIEAFKNNLSDLANENNCSPIIEYCTDLEMGLQSFDIELIEKQVAEFPVLIDELKQLIT